MDSVYHKNLENTEHVIQNEICGWYLNEHVGISEIL